MEQTQTMQKISLTVNGKGHEFEVEPQETLVELLREKLRLMRTKEGCGVGECGSCTVVMDKKAVASCLVLAVDADGSDILTSEGMSCDNELQPMQESFVDHVALAGQGRGIYAQRASGVPHVLPSLLRPLRRQGDGRRQRHSRHGPGLRERPLQRAVRV